MTSTFAQIEEHELVIGKSLTIASKIMQEDRDIQVYLPDSYYESETTFPVLYILDGDKYFFHGVSLQQSLISFRQASAFIIVGINKKRSDRNTLYHQKADLFRSFLQYELIPLIDQKYRTSSIKLLFGWAYAGGFVVETLVKSPDLFKTYIAASPFPVKENAKALDSLLTASLRDTTILFFTSEANHGAVLEGVQELNAILTTQTTNRLDWSFKLLKEEEHRSTAFTTLYHGLKKHFWYYPELQFNDLTAFQKAGGLPYVYKYYSERATRFGFSPQIADWTMFSLTRNAMREDNFTQFEIFINEFNSSGFLDRLTINRTLSIIDFYLAHYKYEYASQLCLALLEKHPDTHQLLHKLGDIYKASGNSETAQQYYDQAKKLEKD